MKRIVPITIILIIMIGFINCGNKDYTKEKQYIIKKRDFDTSVVIHIVKAERIKAYNPKLDENFQNLIVFGKTNFKNMMDALSAFNKDEIKGDELYKALKKGFSSPKKSNSDATIVMVLRQFRW